MLRARFGLTAVFLFCIFPVLLAANDIVMDKFEEIAGRGLIVRTNPQDVRVFIDGVERGVTPVTFENLTAGEYQIRLQKEGYNERIFNVTLFDTSRLVVSIRMPETRGFAAVSVKGDDGQTPVNPQLIYASTLGDNSLRTYTMTENETSLAASAVLNLPAGYRTITARSFGWEDESVTVLVDENNIVSAEIKMKRASFKMGNASQSRRRFNPLNPGNLGVTEFRFEVSAPGEGRFTVIDSGGFAVYTSELKRYDTWVQRETWDGRDLTGSPVPEGVYTVLIEADGMSGESGSLRLETEINYSAGIFPQSLDSGFSGLVFAPAPNALPAGSYQFNASLLFGSFISHNGMAANIFGFPFKIDMRVSPVKNLELATVFNINPYPENGTGWGVSGSVKYNFIDSEKTPFAFAAGISYAWAGENGEYPLSPGKGAGLNLPLSLELRPFSIIFCPAAFWRGPEGLIPELLLSAGILYRGTILSAGISCRCEIDFENEDTADAIKNLAGAEIHITLSNFVISLRGGAWMKGEGAGGFGGIGIGMIF